MLWELPSYYIPPGIPGDSTNRGAVSLASPRMKVYPNPFNPTTTISFYLDGFSHVRLSAFDILGREIKRLIDHELDPGEHSVSFDASSLASGVYIFLLQSESKVITQKALLIR